MNKPLFFYQKLEVTQVLINFIKLVYATTKSFPQHEQHVLVAQLRRAVVSTISNLSEGMARSSPKERVRFIEISYSSLTECHVQLLIAKELGYISASKLTDCELLIIQASKMLSGLRRKGLYKVLCLA